MDRLNNQEDNLSREEAERFLGLRPRVLTRTQKMLEIAKAELFQGLTPEDQQATAKLLASLRPRKPVDRNRERMAMMEACLLEGITPEEWHRREADKYEAWLKTHKHYRPALSMIGKENGCSAFLLVSDLPARMRGKTSQPTDWFA